MTTRIWKVGIVALVSDLFPGRAVPFSYAAIALPSLSCPVFRRVSGLVICLSLKWGKHDPSLQPWKSGEGSGCPQSSHPILLLSLLFSFLWVVLMSYATAAFHLSSLLPHLKELRWQLLPKITSHIISLIFFNGNRAHIPTSHSMVAVWFRTSHCILRCQIWKHISYLFHLCLGFVFFFFNTIFLLLGAVFLFESGERCLL